VRIGTEQRHEMSPGNTEMKYRSTRSNRVLGALRKGNCNILGNGSPKYLLRAVLRRSTLSSPNLRLLPCFSRPALRLDGSVLVCVHLRTQCLKTPLVPHKRKLSTTSSPRALCCWILRVSAIDDARVAHVRWWQVGVTVAISLPLVSLWANLLGGLFPLAAVYLGYANC
jgi:hypothetical protein